MCERTVDPADEPLTDIDQAVDVVFRLNGGRRPASLADWIHVVGRKRLRVLSRDLGPDFEGCINGHDIILPHGASEERSVRVIVHEFAHVLLREIQHNQGRIIERMLLDCDGEEEGESIG